MITLKRCEYIILKDKTIIHKHNCKYCAARKAKTKTNYSYNNSKDIKDLENKLGG